jgi:hypothetical protein
MHRIIPPKDASDAFNLIYTHLEQSVGMIQAIKPRADPPDNEAEKSDDAGTTEMTDTERTEKIAKPNKALEVGSTSHQSN